MTPTQFYISLAVIPAMTFLIVMIGVLLNNSRLSSMRIEMNNRFNDLRDVLRSEISRNHSEALARFSEVDRHSDSMDRRLDRIFAHLSLP